MAKQQRKRETDRNKRLRANREIRQAARVCIYCGADSPRDVEHINGDEADSRPENLARACRSCNVRKGRVFAAAGLGFRTAQNNPAAGARSFQSYQRAVDVLLGFRRGGLLAAMSLVRHTPVDRRAEFAREMAARRKKLMRSNPEVVEGAKSMGHFVQLIERKRAGDKEAEAILDATPWQRKSDFQREIWRIRRTKYGPSGRKDGGSVPF